MYYTTKEVYQSISQSRSSAGQANNDPIVEWKVCAVSNQPFPIFQSNLDFYRTISPSFGGGKFFLPTPILCPEERDRRRLSFRNERKLYKRQCSASGKMIISTYAPDPAASDGASKNLQVYDAKIRR